MDQDRWQRVQQILEKALELEPEAQANFIRAEARGDAETERETLAMLNGVVPAWECGPYRLIRKLGQGGMGDVYLARHTEIRLEAAVKIPRKLFANFAFPGFSWSVVEMSGRFFREQRLLAQLSHPSIARILESGLLEDPATGERTPWFAMEFVDGQLITDFCEQHLLSARERVEILRDVCDAVAYAHAEGVIHRDLKPANILVTNARKVKLLDFGIAKQVLELKELPGTAALTQEGTPPMTLDYAAPEQQLRGQIGTQSDVYALGVVLYELLTGDLPFHVSGLNAEERTKFWSTAEARRPSLVARPRLQSRGFTNSQWADLDAVVLTAIHRDTSKRYETARKLLTDIDHLLHNEPIDAKPDTAGYRIHKFVERNRSTVLLASSAVLLVVALTIAFLINMARSRDRAIAEAERATRIQKLMVSLFTLGDSEYAPAAKMTVRELLDRAAKMAPGLNKDAKAQADLTDTLGTIYTQYGDFDKADKFLQKSLALRSKEFGLSSSPVAETISEVALLRTLQGRVGDGERLAHEAIQISSTSSEGDELTRLHMQTLLGNVLVEKGDWKQAKEVLESVRQKLVKRRDGSDTLGECVNLLSIVYLNLGNDAEAESLAQRALDLEIELRGANSPGLTGDLANLAMLQYRRKRYTEAESNYRHAISTRKEWSPDDPDIDSYRRLLAQVLVAEGKYEEALALVHQALANFRRIYKPSHPRIALALIAEASAETKTDVVDGAIGHLQEAIEILKTGSKPDYLGVALSNLGNAYIQAHRYPEAELAFRDAAASLGDTTAAGPVAMAKVNLGWGKALYFQHRYAEAEPHLLSAVTDFRKHSDIFSEELATTRTLVSALYKDMGEPAKAVAFE